MLHEVFISYSMHDKNVADSICRLFEKKGIQCWIAPRDVEPGKEWPEVIVDAIEACRVLVLVLSFASNNSPQVSREVGRAASLGIPLIAFRIDNVKPSKTLEFYLGNHQWFDSLSSYHHKDINKLANTVRYLLKNDIKHISKRQKSSSQTEKGSRTSKEKYPKKYLFISLTTSIFLIILVLVYSRFIKEKKEETATVYQADEKQFEPIPLSTSIIKFDSITKFKINLKNLNGITWDGNNIWIVANSGDMHEINTQGKILSSYRTPEVTPEGLTWDGEAFWIFTTNFSYIYRFVIDETNVKPETRILKFFKSPNEIIGSTLDDVVWDGSHLWYSDRYNIYKLNIEGKILKTFTFDYQVAGLGWDGETLWLIENETHHHTKLIRMNINGNIIQTFQLPFKIDGLVWANDQFWAFKSGIVNTKSEIYILKPKFKENILTYKKSKVVSKVESQGFEAPYGAYGIVWDNKYLCVSSIATGKVFRMNTEGETISTLLLPVSNPKGITWDGKSYWVFDSKNESIVQCEFRGTNNNPKTDILNHFNIPKNKKIGGSYGSIACDGKDIWYADRFTLYKLDHQGNILRSINVQNQICGLAWDGKYLWMGVDIPTTGCNIVKVDPEGYILLSFHSGLTHITDMAWGNNKLWAVGMNRQLGIPTSSSNHYNIYRITWITKTISNK